MDSLQQEQLLLRLGPFNGLLTRTAPLYTEPLHTITCSGFVFSELVGMLLSQKGRTKFGPFSGPTINTILSFARFYRATNLGNRLILSDDVGKLYSMSDTGAVSAALTLFSALTNGKITEFQDWNGYLFFCNGTDTLQKIKDDLTLTKVGITKPSTAPTGAVGAAGNPNGTYNYRVTFESATHESSPGPISANVVVVNQKVDLSALATTTDAQVTNVNIYRTGGGKTTWNYVGTVTQGTTTATDNTADSDVGVELVLNRDPPPVAIKQLISHKTRLFGITDTTVEYSNYNEPEGWDILNSIPIDNSKSADINLRGVSLGSVLVIGRKQSVFGIYGENSGELIPKKLLNIGLVAPLSLVSDGSVLIGLFEDGVRMFDGREWNKISQVIQPTLSAIPRGTREEFAGAILNSVYYLSSAFLKKTFFFDFETREWGELPWGGIRLLALTSTEDPETIISIRNDKTAIDKWFDSTQDLGANLPFTWETNRINLVPEHLVRIREIHIVSDKTSVDFTVDLKYDDERIDTFSLTPSTKAYQVGTCSDKSICHDVSIKISGNVNDVTQRLRIYRIALYGWVERRMK